MRQIDDATLAALSGSRPEDVLIGQVWRGGKLLVEELPRSGWSITWDATRLVQAQGSITVVDDSGDLSPWRPAAPLGPGGSRLVLAVLVAGDQRVDIGEFRITSSKPKERWKFHPRVAELISGGVEIPLTFDDLTEGVAADRFLDPESPGPNQTILGELRRILENHLAVEVDPLVTDALIDPAYIHPTDRLEAVDDLLTMVDARARMTPAGVLYVYPVARPADLDAGDVVWTIRPGDGGVLVDFDHELTVDGLYNRWVAEGQTDDGRKLRGVETVQAGDLAFGGPHGRRTLVETGTGSIKDQAQADAAAARLRADSTLGRVLTMGISCLPNPAREVGDVIALEIPQLPGESILGVVQAVTLSSRSTMSLTVAADYDTVGALLERAR